MDTRTTKTVDYRTDFNPFENRRDGSSGNDELTHQRLNILLAINAEREREKSLYASDKEKVEASLMKKPLTSEQAFAYLGLLLGAIPPAAMFTRFLLDSRSFRQEDIWILGVFFIVNLVSSVVGYFSGKLIGKIAREMEKVSWTTMLLTLPFIGILWGILAGGAGGLIIFVIGGVFGAFIGSQVGSFALTVFTFFHRFLKKGDVIDRKHFLPLAFGVTFIISAFMLNL